MIDSYFILGLKPGATRKQVQSAYRALAKLHHPDAAGGNAARFQEIRQAYEHLRDAPFSALLDKENRRRRFYQVLGKKPRPRPCPAAPIIVPLHVTLADLVTGARRRISLADGRAIDVQIPKGHDPEKKLRIASADEQNDAQILVQLQVRRDPEFVLKNRDIHTGISAPLSVLRQGGKIRLGTPAGRLDVQIPLLSSPGSHLRLCGKGLPANGPSAAGDLVIRLSAEPVKSLGQALERFTSAFVSKPNLGEQA